MKKLTGGLIGKDIVDFADLTVGAEIKVKVPMRAADGKVIPEKFEEKKQIVTKVEGEGRAVKIYIKNLKGVEYEVTKGPSAVQFVKSLTKASGKGDSGF